MQILLEIDEAPDGRLSGTTTAVDVGPALSFSGNMELLARVEELVRCHCGPADSDAGPQPIEAVAASGPKDQS